MTNKVVVIYSGGMDSFTVLNRALHDGKEVFALTFDYGQRHVKEIEFASTVCQSLDVNHKIIDISSINQLLAGSSLTDNIDIPEGHYEAESMKSTVVPNRNMILLSLAVGYAVSVGASQVYYGAHSGDHAIYPDCRPEFVMKMNEVCKIANYESVEIFSPYLTVTKSDILTDGLKMGLSYDNTWTCYNGREKACGKCGACQERLEAFSDNNVTDPLSYES
ncbi:7-cyano-7-deazaguanine synthase [Colwellia sp. PAMC 20917]|jgi:7-cyano-7-deazaguanine synthase|uniref:7-cyano-7-deazaguanine synthase QueC n=1 Tax=unclassified Colwellia TaxID=196834 RepID=UPI0008789AC6|nr:MULTISPECIES: 7-cyano-7-deazaguanine synthase QueC [unclassified Colwellia]MBA6363821.1 7-cyano-7-deazaguanine synthase QueC [Colwellia sp. BRX8-8]AOW78804.1 7-cyano-7-deazaguanine synthase [Colwellia sp. PAMC 20917]MBA6251898.1 7-cyano-7-deazaguanine synthase QueC [Colwellia sp. MB3u-55]MBA6337446.1 7-cyano-7-deazaguanine synthase QueC [Colwellia sp. BRX8-7]MBA6347981.1 7-cyano-7-deazaguanine synthase QueC [Colwellia sp. BRX8-9]|tara:strand:- start:434 stop:1093 length:660 start_codon:yes stop_codon:yes gene_type:complete